MGAGDLFTANLDLAEECLSHPFVQGIATGNLARGAFCFYVAQDAVFLDAFVRAYALALAKAPDREAMHALKALLDGALDELALHRSYAERWGVDIAVEAAPATRAYTDFLLRVAALEPAGHACAAMAPCMRLYAWLGQQLAPRVDDASPYKEWVDTYADPGFDELAAGLEDLLDRLDGDPAAHASHYRTAMELELAFFAAAHRSS